MGLIGQLQLWCRQSDFPIGSRHLTHGNPKVTWETADKQNYGIDAKFFNSRLSATFDYFIEHRTGILLSPKSTPSIIATGLPNLNIGKVDNHGYELSLAGTIKSAKTSTIM